MQMLVRNKTYARSLVMNKKTYNKSERIALVAPAWLKLALQDIAEEKGISLSEYLKDIAKEAVKRDGKPK